jgi:hypothetical protein
MSKIDPLNQIIINRLKDTNLILNNKASSYNATAGNGSTVSGPAYVKSIHGSGRCSTSGAAASADTARFSVGYNFGGVDHVLAQCRVTVGAANQHYGLADSQSVVFPGRGLYLNSGDTLTLNLSTTVTNGGVAEADITTLYSTAVS